MALFATNLTADESLLTGESIPIRKVPGNSQTLMSRPGGDDLPFVYSGSLIVQGQGIAEVKATGSQTELGKIGKALQTVATEDTALQKETKELVSKLIWIAISFMGLVLYVPVLRHLFRFSILHPLDLAICLVGGVFSISGLNG